MKDAKENNVKIVMQRVWACPEGVADRNTVMDVPNDMADALIKDRAARKYDHQTDSKLRKRGFTKPEQQ